MEIYPRAAVERAMKLQEVILRGLAKKITWCEAAEIIGITDRQMRRWRTLFVFEVESHFCFRALTRQDSLPLAIEG